MEQRPIRLDYLRKLADLLDNLPKEKFYYGSWFRGKGDNTDLNVCGTTACALGWATTIPELGLYYDCSAGFVDIHSTEDSDRSQYYSTYRAAEIAFGLGKEESCYLFGPNYKLPGLPVSPPHDATPKQVAEHIRRFCEYMARRQHFHAMVDQDGVVLPTWTASQYPEAARAAHDSGARVESVHGFPPQ